MRGSEGEGVRGSVRERKCEGEGVRGSEGEGEEV